MITFPRQKIYGYSFLRQLKFILSNKKLNSMSYIKNFFNLDETYRINFVYKARIGFFHILSFIKKNDENKKKIILSPFTVFDMINMVFIAGFEPVFIDHYKNSSEFDLDKLRKEIKKSKKYIGALLLTHYNVNSSQLIEISNICKENHIPLIEDCAITIGSKSKNDFVGKFGDYSIFSFGFYKFVNVLSGGMVFSKNEKFYKFILEKEKNWKIIKIYNLYKFIIKSFLIRFLSSKVLFNLIFPVIKFSYKHNIKFITKYLINDPKPHKKMSFPDEYKFRLSMSQINDVAYQLKEIEKQRKIREENYLLYSRNIKNKKINFFHIEKNLLNENAYLNFPILVDDKKNFINFMMSNKIDLNPQFYRSVNSLSFLKEYNNKTEEIQNSVSKIITLPTYPGIYKKYIEKIILTINKY